MDGIRDWSRQNSKPNLKFDQTSRQTVAIFTIELGHGTWKSKGTTELPNAYDICTYLELKQKILPNPWKYPKTRNRTWGVKIDQTHP